MSLALDFVLLSLWGLMVFLAARRGFFAVALQLAAWGVSIALAGALSGLLAQPVYDAFVAGAARRLIEENIGQAAQGSQVAQYAQAVIAGLPQALESLAEMAGISTRSLIDNLQAQRFSAANAALLLERSLVAPLAVAALRILLRLALFALLLLVTRMVCRRVEKLGQLPVLRQANRLLGAALGFLKGALLVSVLALLLRAGAALQLGGPGFAAGVEGSRVASALEWLRL